MQRETAALRAEEALLLRRLDVLPDGEHHGIAVTIRVGSSNDAGLRCVEVVHDALAADANAAIRLAPQQMQG
ncbi:hypothetical protein [Jannaschia seosinensis]|uniref:hypothetical protein n=1 Tax=Jannaschia seosinensis TaxID=313367 RepID=UPI001187628B|nr:hypothetical protein [Jannaschia seosinensis]